MSISLIVLSFFTCGVFAQTNADVMFSRNAKSSVTKYDEIDNYVKSLSIPVSMSYKDAVTKITAKSKTDNGSLICAELLGLKGPVPPGQYVASERTAEYYKERPCAAKVESAARIFAQYLDEKISETKS